MPPVGVHIWLVEEVLLAKANEVQIAVGNSVVCTVSVVIPKILLILVTLVLKEIFRVLSK